MIAIFFIFSFVTIKFLKYIRKFSLSVFVYYIVLGLIPLLYIYKMMLSKQDE